MHQPTITALEFPRIQQELANYAACHLGKERALAICPLPSVGLIRKVQQETSEARGVLGRSRSVPFGSIQDVRLLVDRAENGGVLRPDDLTAVADTIYGCRQLHRFLAEHAAAAPLLSRHADAFGRFDHVEDEIRRCIERGTVSSRASSGLRQTRGEMASLESRIQERLQSLLRQLKPHLQEALVTSRAGRHVLPVKASSRAAVPGAVHGASASGSTLFIEPAAIAQLADELATWRAMEAAEVEQVLMMLSGHVAASGDGLKATLAAVAELDLVFARARLSLAWDAQPVDWNESGTIDLLEARHPLLGRKAVGNRIRMDAGTRMLIVTGPNTGGKTLLLKTLGLLAVIARCGLHLPVGEGSTLCFLDDVLADIGDHQSLEQSLSTFSGHVATIAPMLAVAGPQTLILLDELGSGTDPHEGTGLGIAVLEAFLARGAYTLATTHLREIKEFGRRTPGCAYAGMGFDGETLAPTYRLIYGALGESRGLDVAARAGMPADVVARARQLVHGGGVASAEVVALARAVAPALAPAVAPALAPAVAPAPASPPPGPLASLLPVLEAAAGSRCRVWADGAVRELTVPDPVRRLAPGGLVPGDQVRLRDGQVVDIARRETMLVSRDADTMTETVVAANLTQLLILVSARQPDFHGAVLARHLLYAEQHGVTPAICLTKADLVPESAAETWLRPFRKAGYQTLAVSAVRRRGLAELEQCLDGHRTGIIGGENAGKSILLALLAGTETAPLRLHPTGPKSWLLDVPGLRELGVWKPDLAAGFREFGPYAAQCPRPGCLHVQEPGCAVRTAVEERKLPAQRYQQYRELLRHLRLA